MKIKNLFVLFSMSAALFTSCSNKERDVNGTDPTTEEPLEVIVSLQTSLKAMNSTQDVVKDKDKASIKHVDVYLTTTDGIISQSKRFEAGSEDFNLLTSEAAVGTATKGGYKFLNVDGSVLRASVVVNSQSAILDKPKNIDELKASVTAMANEVLYTQVDKELKPLGVEPISPKPQQSGNVRKVEFELTGDMSRFQIATVFSNILFKDDAAKQTFLSWRADYIANHPNGSYDYKDAEYLAAQKAKFGAYNEGNPDAKWKEIFKVVKVTDKNKGVFMNDFDNTFAIRGREVSDRLLKTTYINNYNTTNGDFTFDEKKAIRALSYFNNAGFITKIDEKVLAFNFFAKSVEGKDLKVKGIAPRIHFYFNGDGIDTDHQFVNLAKYDLGGTTFKAAQLLNIDMNKINNADGDADGDGIIVISEDPTVPEHGEPDIDNESFNLILRIQVAPWNAVNVLPLAE